MPETRFSFHGHAAALSGRIIRVGEGSKARLVRNAFIDLPAAALAAAGGRSTAKLSGKQLKDPVIRSFVRFESATVSSEGVFDDARGHFELSLGKRAPGSLAPRTSVTAEVRGLDVGLKNQTRMIVRRVRGGFTSRKGTAAGEPPIQLNKETGFDGNRVTFVDAQGKSYVLAVDIERDLFRDNDTFSKVAVASRDAAFRRSFGHALHGAAVPDGNGKPGTMQGTIVKPLVWKGQEFPGSTIDADRPNTVSIPGFGRVYFGEITVAPESRRLTMVQVVLGSPIGGDVACADFMDNGSITL
jgi:hypothetical protein